MQQAGVAVLSQANIPRSPSSGSSSSNSTYVLIIAPSRAARRPLGVGRFVFGAATVEKRALLPTIEQEALDG
jgi:hypothetical protein